MANHLALVSSEAEFNEVKKLVETRIGKEDKVVFLFHSIFLGPGISSDSKRFPAKVISEFLKEADFKEIELRVAFFARNWYKFVPGFDGKASFDGISLGFVQENELNYFFKRTFYLLKAILKAIEEFNPKIIFVNKNGLSSQYVEAVEDAEKIAKVEWLDIPAETVHVRHPNLTQKKARDVWQKVKTIASNPFPSRPNSKKKTVFVRERGYVPELKAKLAKEQDINLVSLDEFLLRKLLNPVTALRYYSEKNGLKSEFKELFEGLWVDSTFSTRFEFQGINFANVFRMQLSQLAERDWPEFVLLIKALSKHFEKKKPDLVVLWEDWVPFERICTILAKRVGAKSLVLQHGFFNPILDEGDWVQGFVPLTADKITVWGQKFKDILIRFGIEPDRVVITGVPRLDSFIRKEFDAEGTRAKLGLKQGEKMVFVATSGYLAKPELKEIMDTVSKRANTRLVVKIHPFEDLAYYNWMKEKAIVLQATNLYELLNISDAVIIKFSTVGWEAVALGKPVIMFEKNWLPGKAFGSKDPVLKAKNAQELEKVLELVLSKGNEKLLLENNQKIIHNTLFKLDGKSTDRTINVIKTLMTTNTSRVD